MTETQPEDRMLNASAHTELEPAGPRWQRGEIIGNTKTAWIGFLVIFGVLVLLGFLLAGMSAVWFPVALLALFCVGFQFVLRDARRGARWDMEGITFTQSGVDSHRLNWSQEFVVSADGGHLRCDGVRYPLRFRASAADQGWLMAAVLQHCWSAERQPEEVARKWWHGPRQAEQWRVSAEFTGAPAIPTNAEASTLYLYRTNSNPFGFYVALVPLTNMVAQLIAERATMVSRLAVFVGLMAVVTWLYVSITRPKQYGTTLLDETDTIEIAEDGVHVWRKGKRSGPLQYPREVSATRGRWLPAGKLTAWSDGEEVFLIDPKRLVALPADTPPRIIFAATEGAGRVGGRVLPAKDETP